MPDDINFFNISCPSGFCFGTLFPLAADKYPDATVELNMTATVAPELTISAQEVNGTITGRIQVYARQANGSIDNLFALIVTASLKVSPWVRGNKVMAVVTKFTPSKTVENSQIGTLPESGLNQLLKFFENAFVIPKLVREDWHYRPLRE